MKLRTLLICSLCALSALHAGCEPSRDSVGASEHGPRIPYRDTGHSVLLLVDSRLYGDEPRSLEARNYDLEWANLLGAHFGGCDIAELSRLGEDGSKLLAGRQLLLLPRRCLAAMDSSFAPLVDEAVRAGMSVLAELPDREWSRRLGLRRNALERRAPLP